MRNISVKVLKKLKIRFLHSITLFETRAFYEIMWKNIVLSVGPQMAIWRMGIACWIPKSTRAHSEYLIIIAFPRKQ